MSTHRRTMSALLTTLLWAYGSGVLLAQGHGGGAPGGGGPAGPGAGAPMGAGGPGFGTPNYPSSPPPSAGRGEPVSSLHGGLQLGPPGRWWADKHFAKDLRLTSDQQKRMDSIFSDNRALLITRFRALQDEEAKMEGLIRASSSDENAIFVEIDRLAEARAALEKANAHMLLGIRHEMSAEQLARLESHRQIQ